MPYSTIDYSVADHIAMITLDRPRHRNAATTQMLVELTDAVRRVDADDDVRVAVVTGRGTAFCVGGDISDGAQVFDPAAVAARQRDALGPAVEPVRAAPHRETGAALAMSLYHSRKPFIAAINGAAVGVGLTMVLPMDVRLAVTGAKLGLVFVRRGVVPEACSSWFLPRIVGISTAVEWATTGRVFDAEEGLRSGLLHAVHTAGELLPGALAIAADVRDSTSGVAVALTRRMFYEMLSEPHPSAAAAAESRATFVMGGSADVVEGVQAFLDKRPPSFPMRVNDHVAATSTVVAGEAKVRR